jgi:hypothetical protein
MCSIFMTSLLCVIHSSNLTRHADLERTHFDLSLLKASNFPYMASRYGHVDPSFHFSHQWEPSLLRVARVC